MTPALELRGLRTEFRIGGRWHPAVRDLSLTLMRDETLALVGESGCGKSVTALSVMGLVQPPYGRVAAGRIVLDGRDLSGLSERELERVRGNRMAMIFQEPMTSLNPVMTVGDQVAEALRIHRGLDRAASLARARELFEEVKIPSAATRLREYPHQFSGGMRQRVMIAIALACEPAKAAFFHAALFSAIPRLDAAAQALSAIPGRVPPLDAMPAGCRFAPRCPLARAGCEREQVLAEVVEGHTARCHVATGEVAIHA